MAQAVGDPPKAMEGNQPEVDTSNRNGSGSGSRSNISEKSLRTNTTKLLAMRMLQGYQPSNEKCPDCGVPMMKYQGIVRCVVCFEGGLAEEELAKQLVMAMAMAKSSESASSGESEAGMEDPRATMAVAPFRKSNKKNKKKKRLEEKLNKDRRESRNDDGDLEQHMARTTVSVPRSFASVTEEGVELTFRMKASGSDERSEEENESDDLSQKESTTDGEDTLSDECDEESVSSSDPSYKSWRPPQLTREVVDERQVLVGAIEEIVARQEDNRDHWQEREQPLSTQGQFELPPPPPPEEKGEQEWDNAVLNNAEETSQRTTGGASASTEATRVQSNTAAAVVADRIATVAEETVADRTSIPRTINRVGCIESITPISSNRKNFDSETATPDDQLPSDDQHVPSSSGNVHSFCKSDGASNVDHNTTASRNERSRESSPDPAEEVVSNRGRNIHFFSDSGSRNDVETIGMPNKMQIDPPSSHFAPDCVATPIKGNPLSPRSPRSPCSPRRPPLSPKMVAPKQQASPPKRKAADTPAPPRKGFTPTPPTPGARKRITINNISSEQDHNPLTNGGWSSRKCYMPAWDNSKKNSVFNDDSSFVAGEAAAFHNDDAEPTKEREPHNQRRRVSTDPDSREDFLGELKHKALMAQATAQQTKMAATLGTRSDVMHIEMRNGQSDDVSALETPMISQVTSTDAPSVVHGDYFVDDDIVESPSMTPEEVQQRWRAKNIREIKREQAQQKANAALMQMMRMNKMKRQIDPSLPDDEKKHFAMRCIQEEKKELPFDEPKRKQLEPESELQMEELPQTPPARMKSPSSPSVASDRSCGGGKQDETEPEGARQ